MADCNLLLGTLSLLSLSIHVSSCWMADARNKIKQLVTWNDSHTKSKVVITSKGSQLKKDICHSCITINCTIYLQYFPLSSQLLLWGPGQHILASTSDLAPCFKSNSTHSSCLKWLFLYYFSFTQQPLFTTGLLLLFLPNDLGFFILYVKWIKKI